MPGFNNNNSRFSGRRDSRDSGGRSSGGRGGVPRGEMFDAVCDKCGNNCQVPFRPTGSRPIFCSNCFREQNNDGGSNSDFRRPGGDRDRGDSRRGGTPERQMHDAVCANCGKDCQIPFLPRDGRPVYCSDCFEKNGNESRARNESTANSNSGVSSEQFEMLNRKLDKILKLLTLEPTATEVEMTQPAELTQESTEVVEEAPVKAPKKAKASKKTSSVE